MRRLAAAVPFALLLVFAAGCGGAGTGSASEPRTVEDLTSWLKDAGECDRVETDVARLPVPPARYEQVAQGLERFDKQANYAALIVCGGVNGFISYFRFPSAAAREAAPGDGSHFASLRRHLRTRPARRGRSDQKGLAFPSQPDPAPHLRPRQAHPEGHL